MKKLFLGLVFALFLVTGFASAAIPSITVTGPTYTPSNTVDLGETVTVKYTVVNSGATGADLTFTSNELKLGDYTLGTPTIAGKTVAAGATEDITFQITIPSESRRSGTYNGIVTIKDGAATPNTDSKNYNIVVKSKTAMKTSLTNEKLSLKMPADETTYIASYEITNTGSVELSGLAVEQSGDFSDGSNTITVKPSIGKTLLNPGDTTTVSIELNVPKKTEVNIYNGNITVKSGNNVLKTSDLQIEVEPKMCKDGRRSDSNSITSSNTGNIRVEIDNPDDGDEYDVGDEVDATITVTNFKDKKMDVVVEATLYDMTDDKELVTVEDTLSLDKRGDEDDEQSVDLTLQIPFDVENDNVRLFVKAYEDGDEDVNCNYESIDLDINRVNDDVKIQSIDMDKTNFECGEMGTLNVNLFNAGKKDQTNVIAILENTELGLSLRSEAPFELKKFDKNGNSATQMFTFTIPFGAKEKSYTLTAKAKYGSNKESVAIKTITVAGCVAVRAEVTPMQAEIKTSAGSKISVPFKVKNNLGTASAYNVEVLSTIADSVTKQVSVAPNQESTSFVELTVKEGTAAGTYPVSINLKDAGNIVDTKTVNVVVGTTSGFNDVTGSTISNLFSSNNKWLLIAGNAILVVLVILLIVALVRRRD